MLYGDTMATSVNHMTCLNHVPGGHLIFLKKSPHYSHYFLDKNPLKKGAGWGVEVSKFYLTLFLTEICSGILVPDRLAQGSP